jgi:hypothetical protein
VVSPDVGSAMLAELFRETLETMLGRSVPKGFMDKRRSMGQVTSEIFADGLFTGGAEVLWQEPVIDWVIVTDTKESTPLEASESP